MRKKLAPDWLVRAPAGRHAGVLEAASGREVSIDEEGVDGANYLFDRRFRGHDKIREFRQLSDDIMFC